jgi:hypothetical protein
VVSHLKQVSDRVRKIKPIDTFVCTIICSYNLYLNNSIIFTIGLFTRTGDTDGVREYRSDFCTDHRKSNTAPQLMKSRASNHVPRELTVPVKGLKSVA